MRKIILAVLGVLLIVLAIFVAKFIIDSNVKDKPENVKSEKPVIVYKVENTTNPVRLTTNGTVRALNKFEIFAEVEGVFMKSSKSFRPGQSFRKGELLLQINDREFAANVQGVKSALYSSLSSIMPDLRLDYPEIYPKWKTYLDEFSMNSSTPELPEFENNKERYFITGRDILSDYYALKNLEERLVKFNLRAPFDGILTEALVNEGTLVRPGQKLGEFVDPSVYELMIALKQDYIQYIDVGNEVEMKSLNNSKTFEGEITRINAQIDQSSQSVQVFIQFKNEEAREGMYLEALINANEIENSIQIPRELVINKTQVYAVEDGLLRLIEITPVHYDKEQVIVQGIPDGTQILSGVVPGAYSGMKVSVEKEESL
ncbi:efflux RND transporter periplasmic adaptor subunit [Psychroflexus montanilacus]|uniref:efflux RND transporter periplasmic adaptor subunit n=1 Tax=Psychroflexus montanilacus TaxID=2873598 RepID=UPI001CCBB549|nr:HlyD family efflux transporter periplasmic adaptor subunit [Psychroflexus montanilacus]MBZ9651451.1 HlyD family efflux transporter periplasmic adaptor subunit [Psychroflexus montanilacus]